MPRTTRSPVSGIAVPAPDPTAFPARALLLGVSLVLALATAVPVRVAGQTFQNAAARTGPAPDPGEVAEDAAGGAMAAAERSAADRSRMLLNVSGFTELLALTGPTALTPTNTDWNVHGTDLGHMFWHRGTLYAVFGDTFGQGSRFQGRGWRSNVVARLAPPDLEQGVLRIESMITGPDGTAKEVIPSRKVDGVERTVIPTNGISTGDRMFLHYMSVRTWHGHGQWDVRHSGLAYSDDDGQTWVIPETATWPASTGFEQVAFVRAEGWVYSFGIPAGRHGNVKLRRVPEDRMLEPAAREYWNGNGWSPELAAAVPVAEGPAGELSVAWNERYQRWMMMYLDASRNGVVLRFAPELTGPWSEPQLVVSAHDHPGLYAPYIVPLPHLGDEIWFTMSKWGPYNVFLMKMTLGAIPATAAR